MITRKLGEQDLTMTTLYILYTKGNMITSQLKDEIIRLLNPQGENLDPLENRADSKITQIIRNMISHKDNTTNIIYKNLINYNEHTGVLSITARGIQHLESFMTRKLIEEIR
ncbi:hypothetical protein SDC9_53762 [bioreactor metagenome]|uniref:ArnR1-like winged helix-turn-helix domain-containing protein n=1 Tax=bioreactor metagenome TaxID=1076179 RepID=A0A644WU50_9ZZZZ